MKRTRLSLEETWQQHRPEGVTESLSDYFEHVFEWAANPDQWTGLSWDFLADYEARFGKPPVLNPQIRFRVYASLFPSCGIIRPGLLRSHSHKLTAGSTCRQ